MADHSILVELGVNMTNFSRDLTRASNQLSGFGRNAQQIGQSMATGFGVAAAGIGAGLGVAVKTAADFDTAMRKAGAIAGANTQEFNAMKESALQLGATTSKSGSEVAGAMTELAAKGFDANQVIAAMPGIISAAEASGEDLALTSDTVSSALNAFGMEASDATKVADVMAMTANKSAAGIEDLQYAFKYAATPAAQLGISMEELAAATGIMTSAGLKGEQAGTTLRASLLRLVDPPRAAANQMRDLGFTATNADGSFKSLETIVGELSKSMDGMTDSQKAAALSTIFGTESVSGMMALIAKGPAELGKFSDALENSGGASQKAADQMKAGIGGALENLQGAFESVLITIGDQLVPVVQFLANALSGLLQWFNGLNDGVKQFLVIGTAIVGVLALVGAGFGALLMFVGGVVSGFAALAPVFAAISTALGAVAGTIGLTVSGLGLLVAAVLGIGVALVAAYNNVGWFRDMVNAAWAQIMVVWNTALTYIQAIVQTVMGFVGQFIQHVLQSILTFWQENGAQIMQAASIIWNAIKTVVQTVITIIQTVITTVLGAILTFWKANGEQILSTAKTIWDTVFSVISTVISAVAKFVIDVASRLQAFWKEHGAAISAAAKAAWDFISSAVKIGASLIWGAVQTALGLIKGLFQTVWPIISAVVETAWSLIQTIVQTGIDLVFGIIDAVMSALQGDWEGAWDAIKGIAEDVWNNIVNFFESIDLYEIGANILEGLANGIQSAVGGVQGAISSVAGALPDWIKGPLGIHSPSRVMAKEVGRWIPEGLAVGITDNLRNVKNAVGSMAGLVTQDIAAPNATMGYSTPQSSYSSTGSFNGRAGGGNTYNSPVSITLHYTGSASEEDALAMADIVEREMTQRFANDLRLNGEKY